MAIKQITATMYHRKGLSQWQAVASQAADLDNAFRSIVLGDDRGQNAARDRSSNDIEPAVVAGRLPPHMRSRQSVQKPQHQFQQAHVILSEAPRSAGLEDKYPQPMPSNTSFQDVDSTNGESGNSKSSHQAQSKPSAAIQMLDISDVEADTERGPSNVMTINSTRAIDHDDDTKPSGDSNGEVMTIMETPLPLNEENLGRVAPLTLLHHGKDKGDFSQLNNVSFSRQESPTGPAGLSVNIRNSLTMMHKTDNIGRSLGHNDSGSHDDDHAFPVSQAFLEPLVHSWSSSHPDQFPIVTFNSQYHEFQDVDTHTGRLLDGVVQPPTYPHPNDARVGGDRSCEEHCLKGTTSESLIAREIRVRESWTKKMTEAKMAAAVRPLVENRPLTPPSVEDRNPYKVEVECDLRPAMINDMEGVLQIYNNEIKYGIQTVDTELLTLADMKTVLEGCKRDYRPFIVAVKRELKFDPRCWPSEEIFMEYVRMKKAQPGAKEEEAKVLGFGLLTEYQAGLAGSWHGSGRYTARVHVYVDLDFRRKKLGTAILDRLLCLTSHNYVSKTGYDWVCPEDLDTYISRASLNTRVFRRLLIETKMLEKDPNFDWMKRFLEDTFCFWQMSKGSGVFDDLHRTQRGCDSAWYDAILWQHDACARNDMAAERVHGVPSQWK